MITSRHLHRTLTAAVAALTILAFPPPAAAQAAAAFKNGQKILWRDGPSGKWETGSYAGATPGDSQPIIQTRAGDPNSQMAHNWKDIKPWAAAQAPVAPAAAGKFQPGQKIWYLVGSTWPPQWEQGTFIAETPGGKQPIIRRKPDQFNPEGAQSAYSWEEVKAAPPAAPGIAKTPIPVLPRDPGPGAVPGGPNPKPGVVPGKPAAGPGGPPLVEDEILKFLSDRLGDNPFADSVKLQQTKNDLGALIKKRGTAFLHDSAISPLGQKLTAFGMTSEVTGPLGLNFGPPNDQNWLFGSWVTAKTGLPVTYRDGDRLMQWGEVGALNTGKVTINKDGTYSWDTKSAQGVIQGKWHAASGDETADQGGAGVVLENAKSGANWVAYKYRAGNPQEEWLGIAQVNHRSVREGAMRIPPGK